MAAKNTNDSYGWVAKLFHWFMALMIIGMLILGLYMDELDMSQQKLKLYGLHKSIGATILILVALRLLWRQFNVIPPLPDNMNAFEKFSAHASHYALYGFMFFMPIVGWMMSSAAGFPVAVFGLFHLPMIVSPDPEMVKFYKEMHEFGAYALMGLIALHGAAALIHHFVKKDDVLKKMLPALLLAIIAPNAMAQTPSQFNIIPEGSSIKFEAVQNNSPVQGEFKTFSGDIAFDPAALETSKVKITVDMNSVYATYDEVPATLRTDEWFNVKLFPNAVFETLSFTKLDENKYKATATLTIKDHVEPIELVFTLDRYDEYGAEIHGETVLKRTAFGIGWEDTSSVQNDVTVNITISASRRK